MIKREEIIFLGFLILGLVLMSFLVKADLAVSPQVSPVDVDSEDAQVPMNNEVPLTAGNEAASENSGDFGGSGSEGVNGDSDGSSIDAVKIENEKHSSSSLGHSKKSAGKSNTNSDSINEKPEFNGIIKVYDNGILQETRWNIGGIKLGDEVPVPNENGDDGLGWPDFYLDMVTPRTGDIYEGEPYSLLVSFAIKSEAYFESNGYDTNMDYCQIYALSNDDRLFSSEKFSTGNFENSHVISLPPGKYSSAVYCHHRDAGYGISQLKHFTINSLPVENVVTVIPNVLAVRAGYSGSCVTSWTCEDWGPCINGEQFRTCSKEISACYADPAQRPSEVQACTPEVEQLSAENAQGLAGQVSRITGAVIGAMNSAGPWGAVAFILVLVGATAAVRVRNSRRK